jgi:hypothetical protein
MLLVLLQLIIKETTQMHAGLSIGVKRFFVVDVSAANAAVLAEPSRHIKNRLSFFHFSFSPYSFSRYCV